MPVQTRSVAKRLAAEPLAAEPHRGAPLSSQETLVLVEASATGEGTHTRWIRRSELERDPDGSAVFPMNPRDQNRYTTPSMENRTPPGVPGTPKPDRRARSNNAHIAAQPGSKSPPEDDVKTFSRKFKGTNLAHELQRRYGVENTAPRPISRSNSQTSLRRLGTPFSENPPPSAQNLLPEASWGNFTGSPTEHKGLEIEDNPRSKGRVRGLGPEGTIIVEPQSGEPVVPGLRKGY